MSTKRKQTKRSLARPYSNNQIFFARNLDAAEGDADAIDEAIAHQFGNAAFPNKPRGTSRRSKK